MKRAVLLLLLGAILLCGSGCRATDYWTFGAFRWTWNDFSGPPNIRCSHGEGMILFSIGALFLDVVFMPLALLHDFLIFAFDAHRPVPPPPAPDAANPLLSSIVGRTSERCPRG